MRTPSLLVPVLVIALAACESAERTEPSVSSDDAVSAVAASGSSGLTVWNLGPGQRAALKRGCRQSHGRDAARYNRCVAGDLDSVRALALGCAERYAGHPARIRACQQI